MIPEYTLFLDESYNDETEIFCIAGCIIKNKDLEILNSKINDMKKMIWTEEEIEKLNPVLHSTELNRVYKNRNNKEISKYTRSAYNVFDKKNSEEISKIYHGIYAKLAALIKEQNITTLCCIIDKKKFKAYYSIPSKPRLLDDWYDIAMQEILESYTHFLCKVNGVGSIIYEARNDNMTNSSSSLDNKMFHNFCKVKVNGKGVTYLTNRSIYEHIRFLHIASKKDNDSGLQLADFIAFNYVKWFQLNENDRTDFMKRIHLAAYNGNHDLLTEDLRACWGIRILPNDVLELKKLRAELKTLKKAFNNLKNEKNRSIRKLKKITDEKHDLEEKYNVLKKEYEVLLNQIKGK